MSSDGDTETRIVSKCLGGDAGWEVESEAGDGGRRSVVEVPRTLEVVGGL